MGINDPAFPFNGAYACHLGISKLEYMTARVAAGLVASPNGEIDEKKAAKWCVDFAVALLDEIARRNPAVRR